MTMNTKWEEDLAKTLMEITAKYQTWNYAMNLYSPLKDFIKDQITKAGKDSLRSLMPEIERLKTEVAGDDWTAENAEGYVKAIRDTLNLIQSRSEATELAE